MKWGDVLWGHCPSFSNKNLASWVEAEAEEKGVATG